MKAVLALGIWRADTVFRNPQTNETTKVLKFEDTYEKVGDITC